MIRDEQPLEEEEEKLLKTRKMQFMINDTFLTATLQDLMDKLQITSESVIEIWYSFALDRPKPKISVPQDEWVSTIRRLCHGKNDKARSYVVGFFNGDLKLYDGKDKPEEKLSISSLHHEKIEDAIFFKSDEFNGKKLVVTCSKQPYPELKISEIEHSNLNPVCEVSTQLGETLNGWNHLALNPVDSQVFAASSGDY